MFIRLQFDKEMTMSNFVIAYDSTTHGCRRYFVGSKLKWGGLFYAKKIMSKAIWTTEKKEATIFEETSADKLIEKLKIGGYSKVEKEAA